MSCNDADPSFDVVCFSNDWDGDPRSKTHLMRLAARRGRVLWVNSLGYRRPSTSRRDLIRAWSKLKRAFMPIREVERNIFVLDPLAIPFYGRLGRMANGALLRARVGRAIKDLGFRRFASWSFLPAAAVVAGRLGEAVVIYHCVDEFSAFSGVSAQKMAALEADLMRRADIVIVSSERLLRAKAGYNPNTHLIRHGVDFEAFSRALDPRTAVPPEMSTLARPIVGYFGLLASDWVDLALLEALADHLAARGGTLVLVGQATMDLSTLAARSNALLAGRRAYADLPGWCRGFDAAIIPFPISELTLSSSPLKAREYLAAGLPVVSTAIPEVASIGLCRIACSHAAFLAEIDAALAEPGLDRKRSEAMHSQGWEACYAAIQSLLAAL